MKPVTSKKFGPALRGTLAAAAMVLASAPAVLADGYQAGLEKFLAAPTSFTAISQGAPGPVTYASMMEGTLAVKFLIPTHSGDALGQFVGSADENGVFVGNGVLIREDGQGQAAPVTLAFQEDGTIIASVNGVSQSSGFMPTEMFNGY